MEFAFDNSGFVRTLCGGEWSLYFENTETLAGRFGRLGCCAAGMYLRLPTLNPFAAATACSTCPSETFSTRGAATSCAYTVNSCPIGTYASGTASCITCEKGQYNGDTGQDQCFGCTAGQFSSDIGQSVCSLCPSGWSNSANSRELGNIECVLNVPPDVIVGIAVASLIVIGIIAFVCHRCRLRAQLKSKDSRHSIQMNVMNVAFGVVSHDNSKLKRAWIVKLADVQLANVIGKGENLL